MKEKNDIAMQVFTMPVLKKLLEKGYRYIQVKGLTTTGQVDHIMANYLLLIPFLQLPADKAEIEVYEAIDSPIIKAWAESGDETIFIKKQFV
ncbi:MAG: hypothetical protein QM731_08705 [Chitinophagaceae bacterium]